MIEQRPSLLQGWSLFILLYGLLLLSSHIWRGVNESSHSPGPNAETVTVNAVSGDSVLQNQQVHISYRDLYRGTQNNPPILLLLHGSPVGDSIFDEFLRHLSDSLRVLVPQLPGYGSSTRKIPDYSLKAYAIYMDQFLAKLNVSKAHLAGYSLGGGVAIYMAKQNSNTIQSIDLLSAIGVQELELMGNYRINRAIYAVQLALIWGIHEGIPHFGLLDDFPLNVPYARSFYDMDQRPLRDYLKSYGKPMLIQHGVKDGLVPLAAAREHYRIVPQSNIRLYNGGHLIVRSSSEQVSKDLIEFVQRVESGKAADYSEAPRYRIKRAEQSFGTVTTPEATGIALVVLMMIIVLSTWISEDLTCIGAGLLAARGLIGFWPATIACFIGIFLGDVGLYIVGKWLGRPALDKSPFKWLISESDLQRSADWFEARGPAIIIISRFIPGTRLPTYFSAGVIGAGFWMFITYFMVAAVVWTPLLVGASMLIGMELITYFEIYKNYAVWVILGSGFLFYGLYKFLLPIFTWKGRRLVLSRWRRATNWEFWSPWIIYTPLVFYLFYLAIRYRSLTVFTAANPSMPDGGFIGESKARILENFEATGSTPRFLLLPSAAGTGERMDHARRFMDDEDLSFPIIVKPDVGQRGVGVSMVENEKQLEHELRQSNKSLLVQEYIRGEEFGVFYYRMPEQPTGHIFSITKKKFPVLEGDGQNTLEELILMDDRAVSMAKTHFEEHGEELYRIPEKGEKIPLVKYGTHARGALFLDGTDLCTERLTRKIDQFSRQAEEFYFGRYDIRVPSEEDFINGENLTILEVNGVTSEATSIYDPSHSFFKAQGILMEQWHLAFRIGVANAKRGVPVTPFTNLIKKLVKYRAQS